MAVVTKPPPQADYGPEVKVGDKVVEPTPNARGGVTNHNVRYVLGFGLAGVIILFGLVYLVFFSS